MKLRIGFIVIGLLVLAGLARLSKPTAKASFRPTAHHQGVPGKPVPSPELPIVKTNTVVRKSGTENVLIAENPSSLAQQALAAESTHEERWRSVFALTEQRPANVDEIRRVAAAAYDPSVKGADFEIRVRLHALEALDRLGSEGSEVEHAIVDVANAGQDDNLKMFAMIALAGIEQGRPGKLNRFLNQLIDQEK